METGHAVGQPRKPQSGLPRRLGAPPEPWVTKCGPCSKRQKPPLRTSTLRDPSPPPANYWQHTITNPLVKLDLAIYSFGYPNYVKQLLLQIDYVSCVAYF